MNQENIAIAAKEAVQRLENLKSEQTSGNYLRGKVTQIIKKLKHQVDDNSDDLENMFSDNGFAYSDTLDDVQSALERSDDQALMEQALDACRYISADASGQTESLQVPITEDDMGSDRIDGIIQGQLIKEYGLGTKADILNVSINTPAQGFGALSGIQSGSNEGKLMLNATIVLK